MTTIIDPNGTPEIIFRSDEKVYMPIVAAGSTHSDATVVSLLTSHTFIVVENDTVNQGIKLINAYCLDRVELFISDAPNNKEYRVYSEDGSLITTNSSNGAILLRLPDRWF